VVATEACAGAEVRTTEMGPHLAGTEVEARPLEISMPRLCPNASEERIIR